MHSIHIQDTRTQVRVNEFVRGVYNWMAIGLALTGGVAWFVSTNYTLLKLVSQIWFLFVIAEIGLVFAISSRISRMQASTATMLFIIYAILNGMTLSFIFIAFARATIASTFFICAATFSSVSIYGWVTKRDLSGMGQFLFMGLIGMIIASLVNIFIGSHGMQMIISYIGVLVFTGLTAYDTQKIKIMALSQPEGLDTGVVRKGAILGALSLYLDFILLFQHLLYILGGSRE